MIGTSSGAWPSGATVRITENGVPGPLLILGAGHNVGPFSEPIAFGTNDDDEADEIEITWPSGLVQRLGPLASDTTHTVIEPSLVEITPVERHSAAGGTLHVRVTPRDAFGVPRSGVVEVAIQTGEATLLGPAVADGLTWDQEIGPLPTSGSAVVVVTIDGTPLTVRPRLWWDP